VNPGPPDQAARDSLFRYNAAAVVGAFAERLRQTVDFETVQGDLVGVVTEAFQPSHVALWLTNAQREDRPNSAMTSVS